MISDMYKDVSKVASDSSEKSRKKVALTESSCHLCILYLCSAKIIHRVAVISPKPRPLKAEPINIHCFRREITSSKKSKSALLTFKIDFPSNGLLPTLSGPGYSFQSSLSINRSPFFYGYVRQTRIIRLDH